MKYTGLVKSSKELTAPSMLSFCTERYTCCRNRTYEVLRLSRSLPSFPIYDSVKDRAVSLSFYSFFLILVIPFLLFSSPVFAEEQPQFYTIQAGSYAGEQGALKLYQDLSEILPESLRSHLRVEKVGSYYTIRVGKFEDRQGAEELFAQTEQYHPNSIILQAYIKDERILRMYKPVSGIDLALETEQAAFFAEQESAAPAEDSFKDSGVVPDTAGMDAELAAPEITPDTPVSEQESPGFEAREDLQEIVITDAQEEGEEESPVFTYAEETPLSKQVEIPLEPEELSAEVLEATENIEPAASVGGQDLIVEEDWPSQEQEETATEPESAEDAGNKYERLGQPSGLFPVRIVAVFTKDIFGIDYRYPSIVHYDSIMDEFYVIGGGGEHPSTRIMIYGPDYFPVASLGDGRGVVAPRGMSLDKEGNLYVTQSRCQEKETPCLLVLNPAFFQINRVTFDNITEVPDEFSPRGIAVSNEYIYLTGTRFNGVLVLDSNYHFVRWLVPMKVGGVKEQVGDDIQVPNTFISNDVAVDRNGRIYIVCPDQGRIFVLDAEWNFLFAFGTKGGSSGKLSRPRGIAIDVDREAIYVVDYMRHSVNIYNYNDGEYLMEVGGMGQSPGWFTFPTDVEVDRRGNLIVADYLNHRVQVLFVP